MPRQRNRGSQQFGENENSFRSNSDSFIDNKEHFDRGRMDIVDGFTSHIPKGKTSSNNYGYSTGVKPQSYTVAETNRYREYENIMLTDNGKDNGGVTAPQPTNTPITNNHMNNLFSSQICMYLIEI